MRTKKGRRRGALLLALLVCMVSLPEARAQRRTSRRTTNPARRQAPVPVPDVPQSAEPRVVSTADDGQEEAPRRTSRTRRGDTAPAQPSESERLRGTVDKLSTQVDKLSTDVTTMKTDQRALFELERLTRAEQRAEAMRSQLRDVTDREFQLQERLTQVNEELQPDAIMRRSALYGTTNPSALRDQMRQGLERERDRLQKQLDMLAQSRTRLEAAVASADREVDRLRQRVEAEDQQQATGAATPATTGPEAIPETPAPTPTPSQPPN
jgi:chromosome segregation ATPase